MSGRSYGRRASLCSGPWHHAGGRLPIQGTHKRRLQSQLGHDDCQNSRLCWCTINESRVIGKSYLKRSSCSGCPRWQHDIHVVCWRYYHGWKLWEKRQPCSSCSRLWLRERPRVFLSQEFMGHYMGRRWLCQNRSLIGWGRLWNPSCPNLDWTQRNKLRYYFSIGDLVGKWLPLMKITYLSP